MEHISDIKRDECGTGKISPYPYLCPAGKLTMLWGRNVEDRPFTTFEVKILKTLLEQRKEPEEAYNEWADQIFLNDLYELELALRRKVGRNQWKAAPTEAKMIILNMGYNMGLSRFNAAKWPEFFRCFSAGDWAGCAVQMKWRDATKTELTRWYQQVDNHRDNFVGRSERLVKAMEALATETTQPGKG